MGSVCAVWRWRGFGAVACFRPILVAADTRSAITTHRNRCVWHLIFSPRYSYHRKAFAADRHGVAVLEPGINRIRPKAATLWRFTRECRQGEGAKPRELHHSSSPARGCSPPSRLRMRRKTSRSLPARHSSKNAAVFIAEIFPAPAVTTNRLMLAPSCSLSFCTAALRETGKRSGLGAGLGRHGLILLIPLSARNETKILAWIFAPLKITPPPWRTHSCVPCNALSNLAPRDSSRHAFAPMKSGVGMSACPTAPTSLHHLGWALGPGGLPDCRGSVSAHMLLPEPRSTSTKLPPRQPPPPPPPPLPPRLSACRPRSSAQGSPPDC